MKTGAMGRQGAAGRGMGGQGRGRRGLRRPPGRSIVLSGVVSAAAVVAVVSAPVAGLQLQAEPSLEPAPTLLGKAAAIASINDWAWAEAGSRLLREPDPESGHLAYIEVRTQLQVLERRGHWVRVRHGALTGWISTELESAGEFAAARPPASDTGRSARYVARARDVFELEASPELFGEFGLYTDVTDARVLEILQKISRHLPVAYKKRYGLEGKRAVRETILLFAREAD